jgi:hypothetical protein
MRLTGYEGNYMEKGRLLIKFTSANDAKPEVYAEGAVNLN